MTILLWPSQFQYLATKDIHFRLFLTQIYFLVLGKLVLVNMENYFKGKNVEEELERDKIPIKDLPVNFLWMQVSVTSSSYYSFNKIVLCVHKHLF